MKGGGEGGSRGCGVQYTHRQSCTRHETTHAPDLVAEGQPRGADGHKVHRSSQHCAGVFHRLQQVTTKHRAEEVRERARGEQKSDLPNAGAAGLIGKIQQRGAKHT